MCTPKPFPSIHVCDASPSSPVSIPRRRISLATTLVTPLVDEVFEKENVGNCNNKRRSSLFRGPVLSALSPNSPVRGLSEDHYCVNTPGRDRLQKGGVDAHDLSLVGKGGFGSVVMGSWKGQKVAVKVIASSQSCHRGRLESVRSEHNALLLGAHRNVVRTLAIFEASLNEHANTVVIMEFGGKCNLQTMLTDHPNKLDKEFTQRCFEDVAAGLSHVHSLGVAHLDVKPSNVFVSRRRDLVKLGDFGCSRQIWDYNNNVDNNNNNNVMVGTPGYQAPEFLRGQSPSLSCDVYSFGVLMCHVLTKETPFAHLHPHVIIYQVAALGIRPSTLNCDINRHYKALMEACWHQNPAKRPTMPHVQGRLEAVALAAVPRLNVHHKRTRSLRL